ncbi:MAG: hypothetical protein V1656_02465 [Candidatus Jorgensenbacteria bacterium]
MTGMEKIRFDGDGWCFAIVNNRLAEIYFDARWGIWAHCYVERHEYRTIQERKWIKEDTERYRFTYRGGYYFDKVNGLKQKVPSRKKLFPDLGNREKWVTLDELKQNLKESRPTEKKSTKQR